MAIMAIMDTGMGMGMGQELQEGRVLEEEEEEVGVEMEWNCVRSSPGSLAASPLASQAQMQGRQRW